MTRLLITGGLVAVEDGRKHDPADQYSLSRKVRVELYFDVGDGQTASDVTGLVGDMASARVAELLGGVATSARRVEGPAGDQPQQPRPRRQTKAKAEPEPTTEPADDWDTGPETTTGSSEGSSEPASSGGDDWDTPVMPSEPVKQVTDAELGAAVQKRNAELGDPQPIRELIFSYNPDPSKPFTLKQVPMDKRPEFLAKLAVLTK